MLALNTGAAVSAKMTCNAGHNNSWCSSESIHTQKQDMKKVNLLLVIYSFLSGVKFKQFEVMVPSMKYAPKNQSYRYVFVCI